MLRDMNGEGGSSKVCPQNSICFSCLPLPCERYGHGHGCRFENFLRLQVCSVSAAGDSSIHPAASASATTQPAPARAAVRVARRVASIDWGGRSPLLSAHSLATASRVRVTATAGVTVTTAVTIPGTAAIIVIATAPATSTVGWRRAP